VSHFTVLFPQNSIL